MNTQQLKCFIAVADNLSFTKASEMLFLAVPTVTHHIKSLEYELDTTLFIRNKHQVSLTSDGRNFYNQALNILKIEDDFKNNLSNKEKTIKIICTSYSELDLLVNVFKEFKEYKPNITVKDYSQALYMLKHLDGDLMLGSDNMIIEEKELELKAYKKVTSYLILRKDNPLNQKKKIYFEDLEDKQIIRLSNILIPFYSRNKIKDLLNIHAGRTNDFTCDDELVALSMIEMNMGVAIIPEYRIPKFLDPSLTIRSIEENDPFKYGLIIKKDNDSVIIDKFIKSFNKTFKNYTFNNDILKIK